MQTWFPPFVFDDEIKRQRARLLQFILLAFAGMVVCQLIFRFWAGSSLETGVIIAGLLVLTCVVSGYWLHRGFIFGAALIFTLTQWLIITAIIVLTGGIDSPLMFVYFMIVFLAGILAGGGLAIAMAAGSIVAITAMFTATTYGLLPAPRLDLITAPGNWLSFVFSMAFTAGLVYLAARTNAVALAMARRELVARRQVETELVEERNLLRVLCDNLPDVHVFVKDTHSRFLINNAFHLKTMGATTQDEVVGKNDFDFFPPEFAAQYYTDEQEVIRSGQGLHNRLEWVMTYQGERRLFLTSKLPMRNNQGDITGLVGMSVDVTERNKAEEKLRANEEILRVVMDNIPQYIFWKDKNSVYLGCNTNFARIAGVDKPENIIGKTDYDLIWPREQSDRILKIDQRIMSSDQPELHLVEPYVYPSGKRGWAETNKMPLHDAQGAVMGLLGTIQDVTKWVEYDTEITRQAQEMTALYETALAINTKLEYSALLRTIIRYAVLLLNSEMGTLTLTRPDGSAEIVAVYNWREAEIGLRQAPGEGLAGKVIQTGEAIQVENYRTWEHRLSYLDEFSAIGRALGVPLNQSRQVIGVLLVFETAPGLFSERQIQLLNLFAAYAAVAIHRAQLYEETQQRLRMMGGLHEIAQAFGALTDVKETFGLLAERLARLIGAKVCLVVLLETETKIMRAQKPGYGISDDRLDTLYFSAQDAAKFWDFRERGPFVAHSTAELPEFLHYMTGEAEPVASLISVPIWFKGKIMGQILAANKPGGFNQEDAQLLAVFANQAGVVVQNARLFENEQYQRKIAETLSKVTKAVNSSLELSQVLDRVLEELNQVITYDSASVMLLRTPETVYIAASRGFGAEEKDFKQTFLLKDLSVAHKAITTQTACLILDTQHEPSFNPQLIGRHSIRSLLTAPLLVRGQSIGALNVDSWTPNRYTKRDELVVFRFAQQVAVAIENARLYQQIQQRNLELEHSNQELQAFAYVASHDLQEPLRKIRTFGDRLKSRSAAQLDERSAEYIDRMQHAAARMQTLIDDLLTFSRVTTMARPYTTVNLNTVITEVLADLETHIEAVAAQVYVAKLPTIMADRTQMRQLFQNLISNALKFHKPNVLPIINIEASSVAGPAVCQIIVRDNGIGFDEKYASRIFGVFQRLHGRTQYEGTGVGLAVCKKIVERHNGSIAVQSVPGEGATFIVNLPIKQTDLTPGL